MKLSATWNGKLPQIGAYLRAPRGRNAYRITGVMSTFEAELKQGRMRTSTRATFIVERLPATDIPAGAIVHDWKWTSRAPKHQRKP